MAGLSVGAGGRGVRIWAVVAVAVVLTVGVTVGLVLRGLAGSLPARVMSGGHGVNAAVAFAVDGAHVWVASDPGNGGGSVTELHASDGSWIRTLSGRRYGFHHPAAIAAAGAHIWVANDPQTGDGQTPKPGDGSVTELNASDGSWVQTLSGRRYGFEFPCAIAVAGAHIWVVNCLGDSVTELNVGDGSWVQTLSARRYGFSNPSAITAAGGNLWVANQGESDGGGSVTELSAGDGGWIRTLSGARYGFNGPSAVAAAGHHVWVTNLYPAGDGGSVTELNAGDGSWAATLSGGCYFFDSPAGIAVDGSHIWVANSNIDQTGGSVTELNATDGSWIRTLPDDAWALLHGCIPGILAGGSYRFTNPSTIAAVGTHIWIVDGEGSVTVLTDR